MNGVLPFDQGHAVAEENPHATFVMVADLARAEFNAEDAKQFLAGFNLYRSKA